VVNVSSTHLTFLYIVWVFFFAALLITKLRYMSLSIFGRKVLVVQVMDGRFYSCFFFWNRLNSCFTLDERTDIFSIGIAALMVESFCE